MTLLDDITFGLHCLGVVVYLIVCPAASTRTLTGSEKRIGAILTAAILWKSNLVKIGVINDFEVAVVVSAAKFGAWEGRVGIEVTCPNQGATRALKRKKKKGSVLVKHITKWT